MNSLFSGKIETPNVVSYRDAAQTSSLLCRGFPMRKLAECSMVRLEVGGTADFQPALQKRGCVRVNKAGGFSLIECVGVLAIIAIVAALLIPSVVRETDQATVNQEMANLNNFSNALVQNILQTQTIPAATGMASAIASNLPVPLSQITTNSRNFTRSFLVDPNFLIGPFPLPYTQTNNLMVGRPARTRIIIVSTLGTANPPNATGSSLTVASFKNLWETPVNTKPTDSTWSGWNGNGRDVLIQRINLQPLFYNLILNTQNTNGTATFSINTTNTTAVPTNGTGWNSYYLSGSVVGLCTNGVAQTRYVLNRNISFVFANGAWNGQIPPNSGGTNVYSTLASNFFGSTWNPGAKFGSDQSAVLSAMANFMMDYTMWANDSPSFNTNNANPLTQLPMHQLLTTEEGNVITYSGTGNWGLLK